METKREDEISLAETYLEDLNDKERLHIDHKHYFGTGKIDFDDEQPKIMKHEEFIKDYAFRMGGGDAEHAGTGFYRGWEERGKCFQPMVDDIKRRTKDAPTMIDREIFKDILNLIIKQP